MVLVLWILCSLWASAVAEAHPCIFNEDPVPKTPGHRISIPQLYHRRYSEQTFIGTHNSVAIRTKDNNWSLSGNQYFNISAQLESGVRLLQAQGHRHPDGKPEIRLCHYSCALMDGGSLQEFLRTVLEFLEAHSREVVTLLFVNTGPPLKEWASAYYETGADLVSYVPPSNKRHGNMNLEDWPTIKEMVNNNQRLVTFLSSGASVDQVPYLLPEYGYLFETNFGIENPDQYTCLPSRPRWEGSYIPDRLSLVNHFLYSRFFGISKSYFPASTIID